ncbi:hypothetical protein ACFXDH_51720 [Streptomyces sp. NPDC059467]|uniref:ISAzo13-like element transposase-related protein n=1 Tax=Streptomyces sp. NPDC059467 TaxID=3346844 RepID=UPI0036AECEEA
MAELDAGRAPDGRVRWPGAGRPALATEDPGLVPALLTLVEDGTQGDPIGPLTWTTKSLRRLKDELAAQRRKVGRGTVAALLKAAGFSLRGNRGLSCSLTAYLFRIGENRMRALIKQVRPLLEDHGHRPEPVPACLIDPSDLASYVMHATFKVSEHDTTH